MLGVDGFVDVVGLGLGVIEYVLLGVVVEWFDFDEVVLIGWLLFVD